MDFAKGKTWLLDLAAALTLLALPLINYLRHNDYPLFRPEAGILFAVLLCMALAASAVMTLGRMVGRIAVVTALVVLVVDVQTDWFATATWPALLTALVAAGLGWLLRARLSLVAASVCGVMILTTLVLPAGRPVLVYEGEPADRDSGLPLIVHLVLDEHIGLAGIPAEFDPDGTVRARVQGLYRDNGFDLYPRAYSRYYNTEESITNLLNFAASEEPAHFLGDDFHEGMVLEQNAWFDALRDRGYSLHVVQSEYLRYLPVTGKGAGENGSCYSYTSESAGSLAAAPLATGAKSAFLVGTYCKLSRFLTAAGRRYPALRASAAGRILHLPDLGTPGRTRISPLATDEALNDLIERLRTARRGQAYFAHLLLPHYPYAFRADGSLRQSPGEWLDASDPACYPYRNDEASRALRYPLYLDQMVCLSSRLEALFAAIREAGLWQDALIIIHGDHGSRLDQGPPEVANLDKLTATDYLDAFSTLFAVKRGAMAGTVHADQAPIDELFELVAPGRRPQRGIDPGQPPYVLLKDGENLMQRRALPNFQPGVRTDQIAVQRHPIRRRMTTDIATFQPRAVTAVAIAAPRTP